MTKFPKDNVVLLRKCSATTPGADAMGRATRLLDSSASYRPLMDLEDALSVGRRCRRDDEDDDLEVSADDARQAAIALAAAFKSADTDRRCLRAALQRRDDCRPRNAGSELRLGVDHGGRRHFLDGEAVHAGNTLLLLTVDGWLPVRYEWSFDPATEPVGYVALPGAFGESAAPLRLPSDARLAWPRR